MQAERVCSTLEGHDRVGKSTLTSLSLYPAPHKACRVLGRGVRVQAERVCSSTLEGHDRVGKSTLTSLSLYPAPHKACRVLGCRQRGYAAPWRDMTGLVNLP